MSHVKLTPRDRDHSCGLARRGGSADAPRAGGTQGELHGRSRVPAVAADGTTRTRYESARVQSFSEWWQMPLLVLVCVLVLAFVGLMYRRDSVELKPGIGILLAVLRLAAFGGLLLMYLDIQKRTETKVVHNSRVVLLVDTSLSMSRVDADDAAAGAASAGGTVPAADRSGDAARSMNSVCSIACARRTMWRSIRIRFRSRRIATLPKVSAARAIQRLMRPPRRTARTARTRSIGAHELEPQGARNATRPVGAADHQRRARRAAFGRRGVQRRRAKRRRRCRGRHQSGPGSENSRAHRRHRFAQPPTNVRVSDLVAPPRAYPGDSFPSHRLSAIARTDRAAA